MQDRRCSRLRHCRSVSRLKRDGLRGGGTYAPSIFAYVTPRIVGSRGGGVWGGRCGGVVLRAVVKATPRSWWVHRHRTRVTGYRFDLSVLGGIAVFDGDCYFLQSRATAMMIRGRGIGGEDICGHYISLAQSPGFESRPRLFLIRVVPSEWLYYIKS